jgi:hypothetical protein
MTREAGHATSAEDKIQTVARAGSGDVAALPSPRDELSSAYGGGRCGFRKSP